MIVIGFDPAGRTVAKRIAEVLEHAGLGEAACVVVTVPGAASARRIVSNIRLNEPDAQILVRARFQRSLEDLRETGAHKVIDEEHEVGRVLAQTFADTFPNCTTENLTGA